MSAIWTPSADRRPARPIQAPAPGPETTQLMPYHDHNDRSAVELNRLLQGMDHNLFALVNRRINRYEVWYKNPQGGNHMVIRIEGPNGEYVPPQQYAQQALANLKQMEDESAQQKVDRIEAHNQKVKDDAMKQDLDQVAAEGEYLRKRVEHELDGHANRFTEEDAIKGLKSRWV